MFPFSHSELYTTALLHMKQASEKEERFNIFLPEVPAHPEGGLTPIAQHRPVQDTSNFSTSTDELSRHSVFSLQSLAWGVLALTGERSSAAKCLQRRLPWGLRGSGVGMEATLRRDFPKSLHRTWEAKCVKRNGPGRDHVYQVIVHRVGKRAPTAPGRTRASHVHGNPRGRAQGAPPTPAAPEN